MVLKPPTGPDSYRDNEKVVTNTIADELRILRDSTRKNIPALLSDLRNQIKNQSTTVTTEHSGPQLRLRSRPGDGPVIAKLQSTDTINLTGKSDITTDSDRDGKPSKHVWLEANVGNEKGWLSSEYLNKLGLKIPTNAPVIEPPAPVIVDTTPVNEPAPVIVDTTPVNEPAPVIVDTTPVNEPAPVIGDSTPVVENGSTTTSDTPVSEPAPVIGDSTPVVENGSTTTSDTPVVNSADTIPSNTNAGVTPSNNQGSPSGIDLWENWYDRMKKYWYK